LSILKILTGIVQEAILKKLENDDINDFKMPNTNESSIVNPNGYNKPKKQSLRKYEPNCYYGYIYPYSFSSYFLIVVK